MRLRDVGTRLRGTLVPGTQGRPSRLDWAAPGEREYPCEFQPNSTRAGSTEDLAAQDRTVTSWRVILPAGADITTADRWRFLGVVYEVDGEVERHRRGHREHHVECVVRRIQGG
jgi:hypothetical protein